MNEMTYIGENLKKCRKEKGFTQKQLADESGISYSMICKLESGEQKNPSLHTLEKIVDALNISISPLFIDKKFETINNTEVRMNEIMGLNDIIHVGTHIKQLRKEKGYSQKAFAEKVNIPYTTYSNYENNNRVPNKEQLEKIASALDVSIYALMDIDEKVEAENSDDPLLEVAKMSVIYSKDDPQKPIITFTNWADGDVLIEIDECIASVKAETLSEAVKKVTE